MKAITIWQPWASLLACGAKRYETRSWATKYRGPIAIHAAMKDPCKLPLLGMEAMERIVREEIDAGHCPPWAVMPRGAVIATAELVNVWHITTHQPGTTTPRLGDYVLTEKELALGGWGPGRYAWELANVKILPEPIPVKGKQGLWEWRDSQ